MNIRPSLAGLALALAFAGSAQAVSLSSTTANGNEVDATFTFGSHVGVDIGFTGTQPVTLNFTVDADDVAAGSLTFDSIIREITGGSFSGVQLALQGASFTLVGSALDLAFNNVPLQGSDTVQLLLPAAATTELYVGDPFDAGGQDWQIGVAGLSAGQSFTLTVTAVPEPQSAAMLLSGLLVAAALRRSRR